MVWYQNLWTAVVVCTLGVSTVASSVAASSDSSGQQTAVTDDVTQNDLMTAGRTVRVGAEVKRRRSRGLGRDGLSTRERLCHERGTDRVGGSAGW
jgi:hypothetical protein